jgi:tetratricopeptide (TPR) repeat protein
LAQDSSFAMAAYYLAHTVPDAPNTTDSIRLLLGRAVRLADHASDRDRLIIKLRTVSTDYAARAAVAESLITRWPNEPDGHLALGGLRHDAGEFLAALPYLKRVRSMDSLSFGGRTPLCRACDAINLSAAAYMSADSVAAAERTVREWLRLQPRSPLAWMWLFGVLARQGRSTEALAAARRVEEFEPGASNAVWPAMTAVMAGDYRQANRLLLEPLGDTASVAKQREALWWSVIVLRNQGRLTEALAHARSLRRLLRARSADSPLPGLAEAQVQFEMGRHGAAADQFDSLARLTPQGFVTAGAVARNRSWMLTHAATASAAAGDTARLARVADSITSIAPLSAYGRDWRLPHHLRGLLWAARGEPERAVVELRRAIFSPSEGYTRTNLELARVLLSLGRAREAVTILQPALRGPVDGSNFYVTRTELHELLAQAFDAGGRPDSAAWHYGKVVDAWHSAEAKFRTRADAARRRLTVLTHGE